MDLGVWRDISLMWLIFLTFIAVLPFGVIFYLAVRGMRRLRQLAKQYLPVAREKAAQVADITEQASQKVANPLIQAQARAAEVNGMMTAILTRRKRA
jgi:hypothetical protein